MFSYLEFQQWKPQEADVLLYVIVVSSFLRKPHKYSSIQYTLDLKPKCWIAALQPALNTLNTFHVFSLKPSNSRSLVEASAHPVLFFRTATWQGIRDMVCTGADVPAL